MELVTLTGPPVANVQIMVPEGEIEYRLPSSQPTYETCLTSSAAELSTEAGMGNAHSTAPLVPFTAVRKCQSKKQRGPPVLSKCLVFG